ncbi:MAG TPA: FAD-dependent oxidoreductase [Candidatus Dormibacteraeota bacterium]
MDAVEVGIIGAGIHGASAAYHLAERGVAALVVDRGGTASGPTGRSSAICRAYYTNRFLAEVAHESLEMFRGFHALTGHDAGFHETGALYLHPADDVPRLRDAAAMLNEVGTEVRVLDRGEVAGHLHGIRLDGVEAGAWEPRAGYADPVLTTAGLLERARAQGVRARLHDPIVGVMPRRGGGAVLELRSGEQIDCARLLIAAGPWSAPLARGLGAELPVHVERHVVATFGWASAPSVGFAVSDVAGGYYMRPEGEELFLAGPLHEMPPADPDDFDQNITALEVRSLAEALTARLPALRTAESRGGWASLYDVSPDWQPVIGEIADGVFVDAGTSGHGFKLAPALGRHVAAMVCGEATAGLREFHPDRFAAGAPLAAGYGSARILG